MQPFGAVERIKDSYQRFVETSFPLADKGVKDEFRQLIKEKNLLWQEPYVSLSRLFRTDYTLKDAVDQGLLSPAILNDGSDPSPHWRFTRLFNHQYEAIKRLTTLRHKPRNTLIATGTGSGKTESFLIPIIDHCQRHPEPGIQAVIVYPMNALANDQLGRLRKVLKGTGVTFGRYTGDTKARKEDLDSNEERPDEERASRHAMHSSPPQILLTNYSMLEYLLVRKRDRKMFEITRPSFLVLDEVHTYVGVLGAEVACLIRRFKEHAGLSPNELCCIGTSATLISSAASNGRADENPTRDLIDFATLLFGEDFDDGARSVIQEIHQPLPAVPAVFPLYDTPRLSEELFKNFDAQNEDHVRKLADAFSIHLPEGASGNALFSALYRAVEQHPVFLKFAHLLQEPRPLTDLVTWLRGLDKRANVGEEQLKREAAGILLLGSVAKHYNSESDDPVAFYRPKVHLCVRSLTPLTMALQQPNDDDGAKLLSEGKTEYSDEAGQSNDDMPKALPLTVCRSCGEHFLKGYYLQREEDIEASKGSSNGRVRSGRGAGKKATQKVVMLPETLVICANQPYQQTFQEIYVQLYRVRDGDKLDVNREVAEGEEEEPGRTPPKGSRFYLVCPYCLVARAEENIVRPADFEHLYSNCKGKRGNLPRFFGFGKANMCPKCGARGHGGGGDIITPLRGGATVSVSILTESLLPELKADEDGSIGEKRLLIFADSRQETAHQAGYMRDRHQTFAQRQLTYRAVKRYEEAEGMGVPLSQLHHEVYTYAQTTWNEADALNLLTINTGKRQDELHSGLKLPREHITEQERKFARARLEWDLHIEFTQRATVRNSLEREGLMTVEYSGLEEVVREQIHRFAGFTARDADVQFLVTLLRVIMDYMRRQRAINYQPFSDYLSGGATSMTGGIARPNKYARAPQGFNREGHEARGAYKIFSWSTPRSAICSAVTRMFDGTSAANVANKDKAVVKEQVDNCIESGIQLLIEKGYLVPKRIGQLSGGSSQQTREAYQLSAKYLSVTTTGPRFRCTTCNDVRSYQVVTWKTHGSDRPVPICANYYCKGTPEHYPLQADNFYIYYYKEGNAERLYAVEHSGQLSGHERVQIEDGFRSGRINVIVCTQTLELGVDIGDLPAIILRNIPPTPSSYAQRSGRPGRKLRIALILTHAGHGPHDSYFYNHLGEMIAGAIRPPIFLIDNEVVILRHINSLMLEKLDIELPPRWQPRTEGGRSADYDEEVWERPAEVPEGIVDKGGEIRTEWLDALTAKLHEQVAQCQGTIRAAIKQAFAREYHTASNTLSWLDDGYISECCATFATRLRDGLNHWCERYREIYLEIARINRKVLLSPTEKRRRAVLEKALDTLLNNREYRPLSYLAKVGFLPSYGFPGTTVMVRDDEEHQVVQVASAGVREYALGNVVYVRGRKLQINRVHFKGGVKTNPQMHAISYKYCPTCTYLTDQATAQECPYCQQMLRQGHHIEYETVHGWNNEHITQEDEYRDLQGYKVSHYLNPLPQRPQTPEELALGRKQEKDIGGGRWHVRYTHLRNITILNQGKLDPKTGRVIPFKVCLECGTWIRPTLFDEEESERLGFRTTGTDHLYSCSVRAEINSPYEKEVDLHVQLQGDVVEIELPATLSIKDDKLAKFLATLQEALKLGLQLKLYTEPREVESFVARRQEDGRERNTIVLYDTMPGGTGYLRRFYDQLPQIAREAYRYLYPQPSCCETSCYSCLKAFENQRVHALLDKQTVREVLEQLGEESEGEEV